MSKKQKTDTKNNKNNKKNNNNKKNIINKTQIIKIFAICFIIILILLNVSLFQLKNYYYTKSKKENEELKIKFSSYIEEEIDETSGEQNYKVDFEALKEINPDTIAYLKVNNTNIDYVVVKGNDNDYYSNHNFIKNYNTEGWIFADNKNKFNYTDYNIVLYGHNTKNNNMFGTIQNTLKEEWYDNEENKYITLITDEAVRKYEIFSIYKEYEKNNAIKVDFNSDYEYVDYLNEIKSKSIKDFNIETDASRGLLTLSTCDSDGLNRIIVHAIRAF